MGIAGGGGGGGGWAGWEASDARAEVGRSVSAEDGQAHVEKPERCGGVSIELLLEDCSSALMGASRASGTTPLP